MCLCVSACVRIFVSNSLPKVFPQHEYQGRGINPYTLCQMGASSTGGPTMVVFLLVPREKQLKKGALTDPDVRGFPCSRGVHSKLLDSKI